MPVPRKPTEPKTQENVIARLDRIERDTEEIMRILRGVNGDTGLISAMQALAKEVKNHVDEEFRCPIRDVATILYGSKDDSSKRGLVSDVEDLKKWKDELRHWYLLFVGAIVVGVANILLTLLQN
jgi:hypothetical protein